MSKDSDLILGLDLGRSEDILNNKSGNALSELLVRMTNEIIEELQNELNKANSKGRKPYATGNLFSSLIPVNIKAESIELSAPFYWKYINYGVNGIKVKRGAPNHNQESGKAPTSNLSFHAAIKKWIHDKGIKIKVPEGKTFEQELNQVAGKIVNHIRMNGKEATHFYDNVMTQNKIDEMGKRISDLLGATFINVIKPKE